MTDAEWLALCEAAAGDGGLPDPADEEGYCDPEDPVLPGSEEELAEIMAGSGRAAADAAAAAARIAVAGQTAAMAAVASAGMGRRGPGMPGSAAALAGVFGGPGGGFATGHVLDVAPGGPVLLSQLEHAAGGDDRFGGTSDDELLGIICAADRCEAAASALKHAAAAALIRRRPAPGCALQGPAQMPEAWEEFTGDELAHALGQSPRAMDGLLGLAADLQVKLPGTNALFRDGIISAYKAQIIAAACHLLDPSEARAAEALVLDRAGRLTPGGLRAAIAQAVAEVNAEKARKRREAAAKHARVERWAEFSGNAALGGRELPPVQVLAADQRIQARAEQLKAAGVDGSMDELRAQAFLDLLLGTDSRPGQPAGDAADDRGTQGPGGGGAAGPADPARPPARPEPGVVPAGFAGRVNLTITLPTLLGLADRPGQLGGIGPIDPWLARDLAAAAARNPKTTWCVTVTDEHGHAIGHGCARPGPGSHGKHRDKRQEHGPQDGRDPPGGTGNDAGPGFAFTHSGRDGPPGGYGSWRLRTSGNGPDLTVDLDPLPAGDCDHRFEAKGHDPGVRLRHLTGVRHATCTSPACRRPASQCDFEHNVPYEAGGRTCTCNGGPKCRRHHRLKQHPRWKAEQLADGTFRWTGPSGRTYTAEPTRYPI